MATHQPPYQDWTVMQEARSIVHYVEQLSPECRGLTYFDYLRLHFSPKRKINEATNGAYNIDPFCSKKF